MVSVHGGTAVWSARTPRGFVLRARSGGATRTLPVRPREVPFDVDLGPGRDGGLVAAYSRCRVEARERATGTVLPAYARGRGCDVYAYGFRTRRETRISSVSTARRSEVLPSVWRGGIAFVRTIDGTPRVLLRVRGRAAPTAPFTRGAVGKVDLRGSVVAYAAALSDVCPNEDDTRGFSPVVSRIVRGAVRRSERVIAEACDFEPVVRVGAPSLVAGGLTYLVERRSGEPDDRRVIAALRAVDHRGRAPRELVIGECFVASAGVAGRRAFVVRRRDCARPDSGFVVESLRAP